MKVKLVFEKCYSEIRGLSANAFSMDIDVELPAGFDMARIVGARAYSPNQSPDHPVEDVEAVIWEYEDESRLVGKLLTYIDATYTDKEQREAHKNLVKDLTYGYFGDLRTRAHQIIQSQTNGKDNS